MVYSSGTRSGRCLLRRLAKACVVGVRSVEKVRRYIVGMEGMACFRMEQTGAAAVDSRTWCIMGGCFDSTRGARPSALAFSLGWWMGVMAVRKLSCIALSSRPMYPIARELGGDGRGERLVCAVSTVFVL